MLIQEYHQTPPESQVAVRLVNKVALMENKSIANAHSEKPHSFQQVHLQKNTSFFFTHRGTFFPFLFLFSEIKTKPKTSPPSVAHQFSSPVGTLHENYLLSDSIYSHQLLPWSRAATQHWTCVFIPTNFKGVNHQSNQSLVNGVFLCFSSWCLVFMKGCHIYVCSPHSLPCSLSTYAFHNVPVAGHSFIQCSCLKMNSANFCL